ncbi:hypothetical protein [Pseudarthrobacter sp. H2]|uniref:hypothetical protein n=1 Tax=Pseudarthrobacter sp. H2 TaxID=3418415 RepID=UPI003CEA87C7
MPFYLEYTVNQTAGIRSAVHGADIEEALAAASDVLTAAGCSTALLRFCPDAGPTAGEGDVVAVHTQTGGWEPA